WKSLSNAAAACSSLAMMRLNRHVHRCLNLKILSGIQCSDKPLKSFPFLEYAGIFQDTGEFFAEFFFQNGIDFLSIGHLAVDGFHFIGPLLVIRGDSAFLTEYKLLNLIEFPFQPRWYAGKTQELDESD